MSLINDALRRASQSDKDRPLQAAPAPGMEPAPVARRSRLTLILAAATVVVLLSAGWFFWQWWSVRQQERAAASAPVMAPRVVAQPAVTRPAPVAAATAAPVVRPVPITPAAPVAQAAPAEPATPAAPAQPVSAPVAAATPVASAPPVDATPVAPQAPSGLPNVADYNPTPWPVDLKLGGIFYSKTAPRALINGNIYGPGDSIEGVKIKSIEPEKVIAEWNGRTRELLTGGQ